MRGQRLATCLLGLLAGIFTLNGCATLDKDECLNADWRIIGYEDGSRGKSLNYLGEHREACAKHGVAPDLDLYRQGRDEGLGDYCTQRRGYTEGGRGNKYQHVCPANLEGRFLAGYRRGIKEHELSEVISKKEYELAGLRTSVEKLEKEHADLKAKATADETPEAERKSLIDELLALEKSRATDKRNIQLLELDIDHLNNQLLDMQERHENMLSK